ncbi:MAG: hypothetical protein LBF86_04110 [Helicobacteraceae bacterium]|jgi:hypothetical protein|nr:hypothetical protein [Helicobacteraceae bacterium]
MIRALLFISLFTQTLLLADAPRVIKREYVSDRPPTLGDKPTDENLRVIRRVYSKIDQNQTKAESRYGIFVGVGADFVYRKRDVEIKTKNNGDIVKVGSRFETANGATYKTDEDSDELAYNIELGFFGGKELYYGAKLGILEDFVEISAFGGVRFKETAIASFVPYAQAAIGAGYEDFQSGAEPNNLSVLVSAGVERSIISDNLFVSASIFCRYRLWQKLEKHYGDEYWKDREIGGGIGARYAFNL